jgi:hypothetical protein
MLRERRNELRNFARSAMQGILASGYAPHINANKVAECALECARALQKLLEVEKDTTTAPQKRRGPGK